MGGEHLAAPLRVRLGLITPMEALEVARSGRARWRRGLVCRDGSARHAVAYQIFRAMPLPEEGEVKVRVKVKVKVRVKVRGEVDG
jgi:hypothetical protein